MTIAAPARLRQALQRHHIPQVDARLLRTGLPIMAAGVLPTALPILALHYLGHAQYALFALLLTVMTAATMLDLGAMPFLMSQGYGSRVAGQALRRSVQMVTIGTSLVGMVAVVLALWLLNAGSYGLSTVQLALTFLATGAVCVLRAWVGVICAVLQLTGHFAARAVVILGQPVLQLGITVLALHEGLQAASLVVGAAGSALPFLAWGWYLIQRRSLVLAGAEIQHSPGRFAVARTLAVVLAIIMSQSDRWILTAMHAWDFIARFDIANRFGLMPLTLTMALIGGLVAEAGPGSALPLGDLARKMIGRVLVVVGAGSVLVAAGVGLLGWWGVVPVSVTMLMVLFATLLWSAVSAATAPLTLLLAGAGKPERELVYAIPAVLTAVFGWLLAWHLASAWLVIASEMVAIICWSAFFVRYGLRCLDVADSAPTR